jgi:hypothetical protein
VAGTQDRIVERVMATHEHDGAAEVIRLLPQLLQCAAPERALLLITAQIGKDDRQRDLALAEIVSDRLAELAWSAA